MLDLLKQDRVEQSTRLLGEETVDVLKKVFLDSFRVVEEAGFRCPSNEVREILEGTGLAVFDDSDRFIQRGT